MNDPVAHWHAEHVYFGQLLKLLRKEIDVFHSGSDPNYPLMLDIIAYLRDYSDRVHHPREDVAFDRLAKHCPDLQIVLSRLQQEHRVIARAGANLHERLDAILAGEVIAREDVLGITISRALAMETMMGVVRLPGSPPMECLSPTTGLSQESSSPTSTMARVSERVSSAFRGRAAQAVRKAEMWISE